MKQITQKLSLISKMALDGFEIERCNEFSSEQLYKATENVKTYELPLEAYCGFEHIQKRIISEPQTIHYVRYLHTNGIRAKQIDDFLELVPDDETIVGYSFDSVLFALENYSMLGAFAYEYLVYFADKKLIKVQKDNLVDNLGVLDGNNNCGIKSLGELTEEERRLLMYPFAYGLPAANIKETLSMCVADKNMLGIVKILYYDGRIDISYENYKSIFRQDTAAIVRNLSKTIEILKKHECRYPFIGRWTENDCPLADVEILAKKLPGMETEEIQEIFYNRAAYLNFLYGNKVGSIDLTLLRGKKEDLVIYALTHKKKGFLRLIEENYDMFYSMRMNSALFSDWFRHTVNINSMSKKNLADCNDFIVYEAPPFKDNYTYTYEEARTLCGLLPCYTVFYHIIKQQRIDDKLRITRQLAKRRLLESVSELYYDRLASYLEKKDIFSWFKEDFEHISGLGYYYAMQLLLVHKELERFIPDIKNENEVKYLIRNRELIGSYANMDELRQNILKVDNSWSMLCDELDIEQSFIDEHRESISAFLLNNCSDIALTYYNHLSRDYRDGYKRIIKAELMGEFYKVKYHNGDLEKEIGFNLLPAQVNAWKSLKTRDIDGVHVAECDGFYDTMTLGVKPQKTCMSYIDGAYRQCLLSNFDSNKHVVYAYIDGEPVARALLRLTKGCFNCRTHAGSDFSFADIENDVAENVSNVQDEEVTLFLERSYSSHINNDVLARIEAAFIRLAEEKALTLNSRLVLSTSYSIANDDYIPVKYFLYISRSKGGEQYFDSLDGAASISDEQSYKSNRFLIAKDALQSS